MINIKLVRRCSSRFGLQIAAVIIAIILWIVVHGQGVATLTLDVPLQIQALPHDMVIINDLPDHVRLTLQGPQSRLNSLQFHDVIVPLIAEDFNNPGIIERTIKIADITIPSGLQIVKLQPDHLKLQLDHLVERIVKVQANIDIPETWQKRNIIIAPANVILIGPEVWLDTLATIDTLAVRPKLKNGIFEITAGIATPSGMAIRMKKPDIQVKIRGWLTALPQPEQPEQSDK
ncbi:MAG: hypothetical protein R8K21_00635 [Mariprofundales bacterium]